MPDKYLAPEEMLCSLICMERVVYRVIQLSRDGIDIRAAL